MANILKKLYPQNTRQANQIKLAILIVLFMAPIIAAQLYFFYGDHSKLSTTNQGTLIKQVFNLNDKSLAIDTGSLKLYSSRTDSKFNPKFDTKKWHLLSPVTTPEVLQKLENITIALGKNQNRVQIALINNPIKHGKQYFDTDKIYMADPNGNIILYYQLNQKDFDRKALKDLKKLLNLSKIG